HDAFRRRLPAWLSVLSRVETCDSPPRPGMARCLPHGQPRSPALCPYTNKERAMSEGNWNPWKLTAIGLALVMVTALVTGMVVANWTGGASDRQAAESKSAPPAAKATAASPQPTTKDKTVEVVKDSAVAGLVGAALGAGAGAIADGGKGAGKGAGIGGVVGLGAGALYGLNENHKNNDKAREAYAACMRSRGYGGGVFVGRRTEGGQLTAMGRESAGGEA